jgi:hypothetical protein
LQDVRWAGVGAAIIAAADDALYLGLVNTQGGSPPQFLRVPVIAVLLAGPYDNRKLTISRQ